MKVKIGNVEIECTASEFNETFDIELGSEPTEWTLKWVDEVHRKEPKQHGEKRKRTNKRTKRKAKTRRVKTPYSKHELIKIVKMLKEGKSYKQIARELKRPVGSVVTKASNIRTGKTKVRM